MSLKRIVAALCAVLLPLTAAAIPVTYEFSGEVSIAGGFAPPEGEMFQPIMPFGSSFSGSFTYDNETPITLQQPGALGYYGAITDGSISFGLDGSLGSFSFAAKPYAPNTTQSSAIFFINDLEFAGNPPYDQFSFQLSLGNAPGESPNLYRYLSFSTGDATAQQLPPGLTLSDPLPVDALLAGFHQLSFGYSLYDDAGDQIDQSYVGSQQITMSLKPVAVPEPSTWILLVIGCAAVVSAGRRRPAITMAQS